MPMGYRGIDPANAAYVELEGFRALTDAGVADVLCHFALKYEEGRCSEADLITECFRAICLSRRYGKPVPLSMDDINRHLNAATDEILRKPVPATLWSEGAR